jgi:hypothetical protein
MTEDFEQRYGVLCLHGASSSLGPCAWIWLRFLSIVVWFRKR